MIKELMELGTKVILMSLYFVLNWSWRFRLVKHKICRCRPWAKLPLNDEVDLPVGWVTRIRTLDLCIGFALSLNQPIPSINLRVFSRSHRFFLFFDRKLSRMFTFSCENEICCINIFEITQTFAELNNVKSRQGSAEKKKWSDINIEWHLNEPKDFVCTREC